MSNGIDDKRSKAHTDWTLIVLVYAISIIGVLAVAVASFSDASDPDASFFNQIVSSRYGMRQAIFLLISPIIIGVITAVPFNLIHRNGIVLYIISLVLLLIAIISQAAANVKAWIDIIWGFTLQPAEFVKLAIIIMLARQLENVEDPLDNFSNSVRFIVLILLPMMFTLAQGEMGSVIVMVFIVMIMIFFSGMPIKKYLTIVMVGILAAAALVGFWMIVSPDSYRLERIIATFVPDRASSASKYQVNNSMIAIGSGGLSGIGLFKQGAFSQLDYVPEDWTDFIFSTIGEASGFIGCITILVLYVLIIFRLLYLAKYTGNRFGELVIIGIASMFIIHILQNIAMTIGIFPVMGIPLPFLSYGGSNLFTNMIGIGLVLNITRNRSLTRNIKLSNRRVKKI